MEVYCGDVLTEIDGKAFVASVKRHGFSIIHLKRQSWHGDENYWERFSKMFTISNNDDKRHWNDGKFENGISINYRQEGLREFYDIKLKVGSRSDLQIKSEELSCLDYRACVLNLFNLYSSLAHCALTCMADFLELDPNFLLDLTDLNDISQSTLNTKTIDNSFLLKSSSNDLDNESVYGWSSSILRLCNYPTSLECNSLSHSESRLLFGSHTDTTFLTISLFGSIPGLEVMDLETGQWIFPELNHLDDSTPVMTSDTIPVIIMTGECLQMITGGIFRACVHRVRQIAPPVPPSLATTIHLPPYSPSPHYPSCAVIENNDKNDCTTSLRNTNLNDHSSPSGTSSARAEPESIEMNPSIAPSRMSCPFLIRGKPQARIDFGLTTTESETEADDDILTQAMNPSSPTNGKKQSSNIVANGLGKSYNHPGGIGAISRLPDLQGINMKLIHMLLERKRKKCTDEHHRSIASKNVIKETIPTLKEPNCVTDAEMASRSSDVTLLKCAVTGEGAVVGDGDGEDSDEGCEDWILSAFPVVIGPTIK